MGGQSKERNGRTFFVFLFFVFCMILYLFVSVYVLAMFFCYFYISVFYIFCVFMFFLFFFVFLFCFSIVFPSSLSLQCLSPMHAFYVPCSPPSLALIPILPSFPCYALHPPPLDLIPILPIFPCSALPLPACFLMHTLHTPPRSNLLPIPLDISYFVMCCFDSVIAACT